MATNNESNPSDEMAPYDGSETCNPTNTDQVVPLLDSDQDFLNCTLPTSINAAGKLKQMLGWRTLVDDEEMSFGLLMIHNKQKAHIADTKKSMTTCSHCRHKKEYDDLIKSIGFQICRERNYSWFRDG